MEPEEENWKLKIEKKKVKVGAISRGVERVICWRIKSNNIYFYIFLERERGSWEIHCEITSEFWSPISLVVLIQFWHSSEKATEIHCIAPPSTSPTFHFSLLPSSPQNISNSNFILYYKFNYTSYFNYFNNEIKIFQAYYL